MPPIDARCALFFDFDGTLADLAPSPDAVRMHPDVVPLLAQLQAALNSAVAVVSGRPLAVLDAHLRPLRLPAAGVHGSERRAADGALTRLVVPSLDAAAQSLAALCRQHPRLLLECKPGAIALHHRQAPELADLCSAAMAHALSLVDGMVLLHGKMVTELKPRSASKGLAVTAFLSEPPFAGRRPWMFGDDTTDEPAFDAVQAAGGVAVKVGEGPTCAAHRLPDPAALRAWMQRAASALAPGVTT